MMRFYLSILAFLLVFVLSSALYAQQSVSIGDTQVKSNAVLYLKGSGSQGLIIPIVSSVGSFGEAGMIVYNSTDKSVYYHNGSAWTAVGSGGGGGGSYTLSLSGNNLLLMDGATTVSTVPLATAPGNGSFFMWDGTKWSGVALSQDVSTAVSGAATVNGLKGKTLPALPGSGAQVLVYDATTSSWKFQTLTGGGTVTSITAGTGLTGGTITTTGTVAVDVGTTANKIVQLDATGKLPAVNGSALTSLPDPSSTNEIQNLTTAGTGTATTGEAFDIAISSGTGIKVKEGSNIQIDNTANVLTINSTAAGTGTVTNIATGTGLTGGPISTTGTLSVDVGTTANKIVQLDATGKLPAVNGSALTSLPDPSSTNEIQNLTTTGTGTATAGESFDLAISSGTGVKFKEGTNIQIDNTANVLTITATGGAGTVTSVGLTMPSMFTVTGSPVTSSGTLAATLASQTANTFLSAPNGSAGTPTFRTLVAADVPNLDAAKITTGTLGLANGGTGATTAAAARTNLGLGTLSTLSAVGSTEITNGSIAAADLSAMGATTNQIMQYNGSAWVPVNASTGTVTSVALSMPSIFTVTGSPITGSGTLTSAFTTQTAATVFAGPTASTGTPTFRALAATDIPNLDAAKITTGTLGLANGGTGGTTAVTARTNLGLGTLATLNVVGSTEITDLSIVDADVNATAAIAGTKINPSFGTQPISTTSTGTLGGGLIAGSSGQFSIDANGNILKINNIATSFPVAQGGASTVLTNDGTGILSWAAVGSSPLISNPGLRNLFVGINAGAVNTGSNNTFLGYAAGKANTSAINGTFVGAEAGLSNTTGAENTFIGRLAGTNVTTGSYNTFVGKDAGNTLVTGNLNTFIGYQAGHSANGTTANTFLGNVAGGGVTSGVRNTMIGESAGVNTTSGNDNTIVGRKAGDINITGSTLTIVGVGANVGVDGLTNATAIGNNAVVSQSNSLVLGNSVNVGIGTSTPDADLTVNGSGNWDMNATEGDFKLGTSAYRIKMGVANGGGGAGDAYIASHGGTNRLFIGTADTYAHTQAVTVTAGNVGINTATPTTTLDVNGYTKLGTSAPLIQTVKLTGTTAATTGGNVSIALNGVSADKILSVAVSVQYGAPSNLWFITPNWTINAGYEFQYYYTGSGGNSTIIVWNKSGNDGSILSKPITVYVTYQQ